MKFNVLPAFIPGLEEDSRKATPAAKYIGVNYLSLTPHIVSGIQDLNAQYDAFTGHINDQQKIILSLQNQLADDLKKVESLEEKQERMATRLETLIKLINDKKLLIVDTHFSFNRKRAITLHNIIQPSTCLASAYKCVVL